MENILGSRAVRLALRMGLAGLGLLLWHTPSAKAQECCPGQYTEAELAKNGNSAKKPVRQLVNNDKQGKPELVAKAQPVAGPGMKAVSKDQTKNPQPAKTVALKQPVNGKEKKQ